jgi:hypothetical protein
MNPGHPFIVQWFFIGKKSHAKGRNGGLVQPCPDFLHLAIQRMQTNEKKNDSSAWVVPIHSFLLRRPFGLLSSISPSLLGLYPSTGFRQLLIFTIPLPLHQLILHYFSLPTTASSDRSR